MVPEVKICIDVDDEVLSRSQNSQGPDHQARQQETHENLCRKLAERIVSLLPSEQNEVRREDEPSEIEGMQAGPHRAHSRMSCHSATFCFLNFLLAFFFDFLAGGGEEGAEAWSSSEAAERR